MSPKGVFTLEKTKRRPRLLWLVPVLALVCLGVFALLVRPGLFRILPAACSRSCAAANALYLYSSGLSPAPGSQLAGDPVLSGGEIIADPAITELVISNGFETLTGGCMPVTYFCQGDDLWADLPFGSDTIGPYGCGPTAMAMVVSSMTDETVNPFQMSLQAVEHGCWARGNGSYHTIVNVLAGEFGLRSDSFEGRDADSLINTLISGKLLVALMGPGHFTNGGHFILLRGVTLSGDILVADPNSRERSLTAWDPELILSELSTATDNGAPIWMLSTAED